MTEEQTPPSGNSFDARLDAARVKNAPEPAHGTRGGAMGTAFRMSADLVSAVVVGGGIGWGLDWLFGTDPWLLLLFFFCGIAAGIMNVFRTARAMNARSLAETAALDDTRDNRGNDFEH